jgi:hypothetical protein
MHHYGNPLRSRAALEAHVRKGAGTRLDIAAELPFIFQIVLGVLGVVADALHQEPEPDDPLLARLQGQRLPGVDLGPHLESAPVAHLPRPNGNGHLALSPPRVAQQEGYDALLAGSRVQHHVSVGNAAMTGVSAIAPRVGVPVGMFLGWSVFMFVSTV